MSDRRPPSAEVSWELIAALEEGCANDSPEGTKTVSGTLTLQLCRTIRELCDERDRLLEIAAASHRLASKVLEP